MIGLGVMVLVGWLAGREWLKTVVPGTVSMKPLTAVGLTSAGSSLFFPARRQSSKTGRALTTSAARKVGVVSVHYRRPGVPPEGQETLRHFAPSLAEVVALCGLADGAS